MCLRVTDMRGIDLTRFVFDYDLTFSVLLAHPDGHVLHRYGGRDSRDAARWLSEDSFAAALEAGLAAYEDYERSGKREELGDPVRIEEVPSFKRRDRGECIHCHSINTSLYEEELARGGPPAEWIWKHPPPTRLGFDLERDDQRRVTDVAPDSPAHRAGLRAGDRLLAVDGVPIATATDVLHALDRAPGAGRLVVRYERAGDEAAEGDTTREASLELPAGWKVGTPAQFAWRPTKWALTPAPGFGGPALERAEKERLGLDPDGFAFRVSYLVTWGDNRRYGQAAARAGLRKGDVVHSVGGKRDFDSIEHFHAWWRLTVPFGETVEVETLRDGEPRTVHLRAIR